MFGKRPRAEPVKSMELSPKAKPIDGGMRRKVHRTGGEPSAEKQAAFYNSSDSHREKRFETGRV